MSKKYISMQEASEFLGVSYKTIQRQVKDKKLKSRKRGNVREVLIEDTGQETDGGGDNVRDKDRTSPKTKGQEKEQTEVGFLRDMITKQQGTIEEQNKRLGELNILVGRNQETLTSLTKTLQLTAGTRTEDGEMSNNVLRQEQDNARTEKDSKVKVEPKNKALGGSRRRFIVLVYVLTPLLVILLTLLGLMYFKVIPPFIW